MANNTFDKDSILFMYNYDTVTEAVVGLRKRGYILDFNLLENCIVCNEEKYKHDEFEIVEVYRFEGNSDPADEAIVYAIESHNGKKGIMVSGYGISAESLTTEMAEKLSFNLKPFS